MLRRLLQKLTGDPIQRTLKQYGPLVERINALEPQFEALTDEELRAKTTEFRRRLAKGETLDDLLPEAFAAVREAAKRTLGLRHYDVQLMGGAALHEGKAIEMKTGEGKTLVATLPLYLNALALNPKWVEKARAKWGDDPDRWEFVPLDGEPVGRGVHLATVNDYLARRDARWMGPIYDLLGLTVGVLQMASGSEGTPRAYLVDLKKRSSKEQEDQLRMVPRREAYKADILYTTAQELGFDYLRDNMALRAEDQVQRNFYFVIIDEVDNVLIDEARTPLIISGPASEDVELYRTMAQVVKRLKPGEDVEINEKDNTVVLTELGEARVEEMLGMPLRDPERPEDLTPDQERIWGYLEQALRAQFLFKRDKHYVVMNRQVIIVDEFTGRLMPGRRWSHGLHQAVEAKEGVPIQPENMTYATITLQNFFRMYEKLAGMSGTVLTEAEEFRTIYNLDVAAVPTNLEYMAMGPKAPLVALEDVDEEGYRYTYYARRDDPEKKPIYWKRKDYPDVVYRTEEAKFRAITWEILRYHIQGRPILVGTTSVELSERLAARLDPAPLRKLAQIMLVRDAFLKAREDREEGRMYPELEPLYKPLDQVRDTDIRKLAREVGLKNLQPDHPENLERLRDLLLPTPSEKARWGQAQVRLQEVLRKGIPRQVLNAKEHAREGQIIARAGELYAVTIATNMAGRGVDIKLGGELPEEVIHSVNRVLSRAGYEDPYNMRMDERYEALKAIPPETYGIYTDDIYRFLDYIENMHRVRELGGLYVIGSERHEARRIDNQLRGRAGRQGDPGSSRFFLSLEDELVRLFGGEQVAALMERFKVDELVPLEHPLVNKVIEQAQKRVEGANFDTRKHLLEYDDVLNKQREQIYRQRNRILHKPDLSEDVAVLLREEIRERLARAQEQGEEPWTLLAYFEEVQPPFPIGEFLFPSFTLRVMLEDLYPVAREGHEALERRLREWVRLALEAEARHRENAARRVIQNLLSRLEEEVDRRLEALETFLEGLTLTEEPLRPAQLQVELQSALRMALRLPNEVLRALAEDPLDVGRQVQVLLTQVIRETFTRRLQWGLQRVLGPEFTPKVPDLDAFPPEDVEAQLMDQVRRYLEQHRERVFKAVAREMQTGLSRIVGLAKSEEPNPERPWETRTGNQILHLLLTLAQERRTGFDAHHRKVLRLVQRLTYYYAVAEHLSHLSPDEWEARLLEHMEAARQALYLSRGADEFERLRFFTMADLEEKAQQGLRQALGEEVFETYKQQPLEKLPEDVREKVIQELGRQVLTEDWRYLFLQVFNSAWAEYLTQMEALRTSVRLESYAHRDPLAIYKAKAFDLYEQLLRDIRAQVIHNMFHYHTQESMIKLAAFSRMAAQMQQAAQQAQEAARQEEAQGQAPRLPVAEAVPAAPAAPSEEAQPEAQAAASASARKKKRKKRKKRRR